MGEVVKLRRYRRFFGVEQLGQGKFRARSFIGWFPDPAFLPDRHICGFDEAAHRALKAGERLGIPVIVDRAIWRGQVHA